VTNSKLQSNRRTGKAARDYQGIQSANGTLPNPDSDAFAGELSKLHIGKLVYVGM